MRAAASECDLALAVARRFLSPARVVTWGQLPRLTRNYSCAERLELQTHLTPYWQAG